MVLNDKYGFSREQLQAVTDDIFGLYASYEQGILDSRRYSQYSVRRSWH